MQNWVFPQGQPIPASKEKIKPGDSALTRKRKQIRNKCEKMESLN